MIPQEILKKIKRIQIRTDHLVSDALVGEFESVFKGRGMEFEEVREYQAGDDIRNIDWNVTARMGHPYVKEFKEERELTIMLIVDVSASGTFGSSEKLKRELSAEVAAVFAYLAIKNNDKVGLIIFSDIIEKYIPPKKGRNHVFRVIREVLAFSPKNKKTNIQNAINYLFKVQRKKAVCFLISDFIDVNYEKALNLASKKYDFICTSITDERELRLPNIGLVELQDPETFETTTIDTFSDYFVKKFEHIAKEKQNLKNSLFKKLDIDHIELFTNKGYIDSIIRFFKRREKRR